MKTSTVTMNSPLNFSFILYFFIHVRTLQITRTIKPDTFISFFFFVWFVRANAWKITGEFFTEQMKPNWKGKARSRFSANCNAIAFNGVGVNFNESLFLTRCSNSASLLIKADIFNSGCLLLTEAAGVPVAITFKNPSFFFMSFFLFESRLIYIKMYEIENVLLCIILCYVERIVQRNVHWLIISHMFKCKSLWSWRIDAFGTKQFSLEIRIIKLLNKTTLLYHYTRLCFIV